MLCPLCNEDPATRNSAHEIDRNLKEMETHLKEVHHLDEDDLEQFRGDFSYFVQAQIDIEKRSRVRQRQVDLVLFLVGSLTGFYLGVVVGSLWF